MNRLRKIICWPFSQLRRLRSWLCQSVHGLFSRLLKVFRRLWRIVTVIVGLGVLIILIWGGYTQGWEWTGFPIYNGVSASPASNLLEIPPQREKTLWEWMDLILVPLTLFIIATLFNQQVRTRDQHREDRQEQLAKLARQERYREDALQSYFNEMATLMLQHNLLADYLPADTPAWKLAQLRTITILRRMTDDTGTDRARIGEILTFLRDSGLLTGDRGVLAEASLYRMVLQDANLWEANLQGARLAGANLQKAYLTNANLQKAHLSAASLQNAKLAEANLRGADLQYSNLQGADMWETNLQEANLVGANLLKAQLPFSNLQGAELAEARLQMAILRNANLEGTNLTGANLQLASLTNANLKGANLSGANLQGAILEGANMQGAKLMGTIFDETILPDGYGSGKAGNRVSIERFTDPHFIGPNGELFWRSDNRHSPAYQGDDAGE